MGFFKKLLSYFSPFPQKAVIEDPSTVEMIRARDDKGRYIGDDPNTEVDEAWTKKKQ